MKVFLRRLALIAAVAAAVLAGSRVQAQGYLDAILETADEVAREERSGGSGKSSQQILYEENMARRQAYKQEKAERQQEQEDNGTQAATRAEKIAYQSEQVEMQRERIAEAVSSGKFNKPGVTTPEICLDLDMKALHDEVFKDGTWLKTRDGGRTAAPDPGATAQDPRRTPPAGAETTGLGTGDGLSRPYIVRMGYPYTDY